MFLLRRAALAAVLLLTALAPASADERILRFVSDLNVQTNGDLLVAETIAVRAEGTVIKHGITRDFPTIYNKPDGTQVEIGFEVSSVRRDGTAENFTMERLTNGWRVQIGRGDTFITTGTHEYVIKYRTTRQIG